MKNTYIVDTNVLIELWNKYYQYDIASDYWKAWIECNSHIIIPEKVVEELTAGRERNVTVSIAGDKVGLHDWVKTHFHDATIDVQEELIKVLAKGNEIADQQASRPSRQLSDLQQNADAYIIAYAIKHNAIVLTQEARQHGVLKIPNLCHELNIECLDISSFHRDVFESITGVINKSNT